MIFQSLRLASGIVCVGVTLVLGAHWLGLIPNVDEAKVRARTAFTQTVAVNAVTAIERQRWTELNDALKAQLANNPDVISIGMWGLDGELLVDTGQHAALRPGAGFQQGAFEFVQIPLRNGQQGFGQLEFCFHRPRASMFAQFCYHPLTRLLAFFIVAGLAAYTVCVLRIMVLFNQMQLVPDRVRQALDTLAEGLLILDEQGRIVLANRAFASIVKQSVDSLAETYARDLNWIGEEADGFQFPWMTAIETTDVQAERMLPYELPDGSQRIFSVNAASLVKVGNQRGALATFRDVTHVEQHRAEQDRMLSLLKNSRDDIKRKNQELEVLATQDALTGCLNRRAFFEHFDSVWREAMALGTPLSCLMLDIDHFKHVNDTFGHHAGDDVLRIVASTIRDMFADRGLICRYGGEEFCVVLPEADLAEAIVAAEQTRIAIMEIRLADPAELALTISIGVSELRFQAEDTQGLINQADASLYVAKREGRNRVMAYNTSMAGSSADEDETPRERVEIPFQAVTALVTALSYRDANTAEHSRRVADLCARASEGLLDPAESYVTEVAALLHDIGKIGVPDEILLKEGELTAEEWQVMGRYDRIGQDLIEIAFDCPALSEIASNFQALFDGSDGDGELATNQDIPLGARLLAIADTYDSITSDRCYRDGRSHDEAVEELRRCAGSQFDPDLVEHFAKSIDPSTKPVATGAIEIQKQAAFQLGNQVEELAGAVTARDVDRLLMLASELSDLGREMSFDGIESAAEQIKIDAVNEEVEWISLIREAYDLMDLCRSTQSEFLKSLLEAEAISVNDGRGPVPEPERGQHIRASRR